METKITSQTDTEVQFNVSLDADALKPIVAEVYDHLRPRVKAAGFRPGKAPNAIVERELGANSVQAEVMDHAIQHTYADAVREHKWQVVASPEVTLEKFVPYTELAYSAKVELLAKPKLGDYKKIRVKRPEFQVDPLEVDATIEDLRRREATRVETKDAARLGDEMTFDFDGSKDGQPVRGASAKNHVMKLGSGQFIPGFEEELVGLKAGDDKKFDIVFPKDYHEESLKGQKVTFTVKVHKVVQLVLPEVNDDFVAAVSPFKTVAELRTDILDKKTAEKTEQAARDYEQKVLDEVLKTSQYQLPQALVTQQLDRMKQELAQNLAYSGLDISKYLEMSGRTEEQMEAELRPEAEKRVALALVLTEIAERESLSVTADELKDELGRLKSQYPDPQTQAELDRPETREEIYNHLMASRVIAKLIEYAESK